MLAWLKRSLALMPPKAYRWVAEMHEIAGFVGEDPSRQASSTRAPRISTSASPKHFDGDKNAASAANLHGVPGQGLDRTSGSASARKAEQALGHEDDDGDEMTPSGIR